MVGQVATGTSMPDVSGTRGRLLTALRVAGGPLGVDELAEQLALHRNTVRFHMEGLAATGLVEEGRQPTGGKGRPRAVFRATSDGFRSGRRNYRLMASILVNHLARTSADPTRDAHEAGLDWGRQHAMTASGVIANRRRRHRTTIPAVIDTLDRLGFEPRPSPPRRPTQIQLFNCPFREAVDEHQDLVCALHAGLLEGMLAPIDHDQAAATSSVTVQLEPLATPQMCLVHVRRGTPSQSEATVTS